jgi:hypothetical protein
VKVGFRAIQKFIRFAGSSQSVPATSRRRKRVISNTANAHKPDHHHLKKPAIVYKLLLRKKPGAALSELLPRTKPNLLLAWA